MLGIAEFGGGVMATVKSKTVRGAEQATQAFDMALAGQDKVRENMDRTMAAMSEMGSFGKENMEAWIASATAASKGVEALSARAVAYSKQAMEQHMAATKAIMTSKSVQEMVERQAEYARSAFDGYLAEMNEMSDLMSGLTKEAIRPINERITAVSSLMQNNVAR
jgi:phasin family protein